MTLSEVHDIVRESSIYWWYRSQDPDDDTRYKELLKVSPDALCKNYGVIVDLKTTRDGSYSGWQRQMQNLYYHVSAAMYLEGVNQCKELLQEMGHFAYNKFVHVCVENEPPYLTSVYELHPDYIEIGKAIYRRALRELRRGRENSWPPYPDEIRPTHGDNT